MARFRRYGIGQTILSLAVAGGIFAYKLHGKSTAHDQMKAGLAAACGGDKPCKAALEKHFDSCFEQNYDIGGSRQAAKMNQNGFLACINTNSGVDYFALDQGAGSEKKKASQKPAH